MSARIGRRAVPGLLAALALPLIAGPAEARPPFRLRKEGQAVLSPPILDEDGRTRQLGDFAGRVVLLNLWATWCPPCRKEMPDLDALQGMLGGADFMVLPICIDESGIGTGRRFYDEIGLRNLPLYWSEPLRAGLAFGFLGLPTTLLIDRQSREIGRLQGPFDWTSDASLGQIRSLL